MKRIAHIENDMSDKFGIPRQSGLVCDVISTIVFEPKYRNADAVKGLEDFSHIWIIWEFDTDTGKTSEEWSPMVRPPRLGGNTRVGVFATRSPNRPNPLGLSCVKITEITSSERGPLIRVAGADLKNGTSILDIKPYLPYTDSHPEASGGFADDHLNDTLNVIWSKDISPSLPDDIYKAASELLSQDPRPSYQNDPGRIYGMKYAGYDIRFKVDDKTLTVTEVEPA
ncbi:MAG: tRNA (N6-threonylcarbamoyladenosine(37)-N6)-methyltransferase TrmO [Lachnospiraceae bacterium]|nr:tRNA (N6-threonylcarbamoyladenosine(37)-N6)-methyltransferase TrmO [Lachnospiraceae bacterium]